MKKLSKLVALAASLIVATFVGCSNISDGNGIASEGYRDANGSLVTKSLTLNVTSESDLIDFSSSTLTEEGARTITPAALKSDDVYFYLGGYNLVTGDEIAVQKVTFAGKASTNEDGDTVYSKTEGTITVDLEATNYRFTLLATQEEQSISSNTKISTLISKSVLIGYATADLRYTEESASVNFVLSSDGLTSGNGNLELSLYLKDWSDKHKALKTSGGNTLVIANAKGGLYKIADGSTLSNSAATLDFTDAYSEANAIKYYGKSGSSDLVDIPTGTYDFTVAFTLANGKVYIYSEKVVILYNQTTTALIGIPPVIDLEPNPPKNFQVGYIPPSNKETDYYKAVFNWEDDSNNELFFELDLYDVTDNENVDAGVLNTAYVSASSTGIWGTKTASTDSNITTYSNADTNPSDTDHASTVFYGLKVDNGPSWYAGSLNRNNEFAIFYLELGKRYLARIRAVNAAGDSDYATTIVTTATGAVVSPQPEAAESGQSVVYSTPAATKYCVKSEDGEVTAERATLTANEGNTSEVTSANKVAVYAFNTEVINLFRVRYELNGGVFTSPSSLDTVYYFDQLADGNPILQPDGDAVIKLADGILNSNELIYNGSKAADGTITNAAVTVKSAETNGKPWTDWTVNSIDTIVDDTSNKYESDYEEIKAAGTSGATVTWADYTSDTDAGAVGKDILSTAIIYRNAGFDSSPNYVVAAITKVPAATDTNKYYKRTLKAYDGWTNIVLYANYTSATFGVTLKNVEDYTVKKNLNITAKVTGSTSPKPVLVHKDSSGADEDVETVDLVKTSVNVTTPAEYDASGVAIATARADTDSVYAKRTGAGSIEDPYVYTDLTATELASTTETTVYKRTSKAVLGTPILTSEDYIIVNRTKDKVEYATTATTASTLRSTTDTYATKDAAGNYTIVNVTAYTYTVSDDTDVYKQTASSPATYESTSVKASTVRDDTTNTYATKSGETYTVADVTAKTYEVPDSTSVYKVTTETATIDNLTLTYKYNTESTNGVAAFGKYDKVLVEVYQQGTSKGSSVGVYSESSGSFTIPVTNFKSGTYYAVVKAYTSSNNNATPYTYTVYFQLND